MRNKIFLLSAVTLLALMLGACSVNIGQGIEPQPHTLNVNGTGKVFLTPDIAYISIGVHSQGKEAAETVAQNNAQSQKVADALKSFVIDPRDIQTTNFNIYPQQQYDNDGKLVGVTYVVNNTVYVTLRDLDKVGEILGGAVEAGANSINSIQFDVADRQAALTEARTQAIENAQTQAEELAKVAGVTLGPVQSINVFSGFPVPVFEGKGFGGGGEGAPAAVPISPGQMILTIEVNVVYEIR